MNELAPLTAEGSVTEYTTKGKKYYYIRNLPLSYDNNGKKVMYRNPKGGFKDKETAQKEQRRLIAERNRQQSGSNAGVSYYEYCKAFYENKMDIKPQTKKQYLRLIERVFKEPYQCRPITALKRDELQLFLNKQEGSRHIVKIIINQTIKELYENDYIAKDISKGLKMPKVDTKGKTIKKYQQRQLPNRQEQEQFLRQLKQEDKPLNYVVMFMLCCGLRIGEALALQWSDIDLKNCCVKINKSYNKDNKGRYFFGDTKNQASVRVSYFPPSIVPMLEDAKRNSHSIYFAANSKGNLPIEPHNFNNRYFVEVAKRAGLEHLKITSHIARHIYITRMVYAGVPLKDIQRQVGHTDLRMIMNVYLHYEQEGAKERIKAKADIIASQFNIG